MNRELIDRIETELDPGGEIRRDVDLGSVTAETVAEYATEMADHLDDAFADEGWAGVSINEVVDYIRYLLDEAGLKPGFYGTDQETFLVNDRGEVWLIQSVNFSDERVEKIAEMPNTAVPLSDELCADIDIPERIR